MAEYTREQSVKASLLTAIANNFVKAEIHGPYPQSVKANFQIANARIPTAVKNLTIGFSNQPGTIAVKSLAGAVTNMYGLTTLSGIFMVASDTIADSYTLASGETIVLGMAVAPAGGTTAQGMSGGGIGGTSPEAIIFAIPFADIFQDSIGDDNLIPHGLNVQPGHYEIDRFHDWTISTYYGTMNDWVSYFIYIRNLGASHEIFFRGNFRSIIEPVEIM